MLNCLVPYLAHDNIPSQSDCIGLRLDLVVLVDGVLEEVLRVFVRVALVDGDEDDSSNLESEDDDEEEAVGSEEDPRLFDGPAVSEERDDEDEGADCDEDVRPLLNDFRLCELLYICEIQII